MKLKNKKEGMPLYFKAHIQNGGYYDTGFHKVDFQEMKRKAAYRQLNKKLRGY